MSQRTSPHTNTSHANTSNLGLALLLALLTAFEPLVGLLALKPAIAQTPAPSFSPPNVVPKGTTVRVDGSSSMATINLALKKVYEEKYAGTRVTLAEDGSDAALKALVEGKVDLAAIGRALTPEETQQGLVAAPIARHKIAIIVSPKNPFTGDITFEQFAKIFRGEIKDWSELGGAPGVIRLVDRPTASDTRQAFRPYPVFQKAPFQTGEKTQQVAKDSTDAVVQALGTDGMGYAIADQVFDRQDVRIISMHKTLPDDPRYPFSQPLAYVYKGNLNPTILSFLGIATAPASQPIIEAARKAGAKAAADGSPLIPVSTATAPDASPAVASSPAASASTSPEVGTIPPETGTKAQSGFPWWLLLIPLVGGLLWLWFKGRRPDAASGELSDRQAAPPVSTPPVSAPPSAPPVSEVSGTEVPAPEVSSTDLAGEAAAIGGGAAGTAGLAGTVDADTTNAGTIPTEEGAAIGSATALEPPTVLDPSLDPSIAAASAAVPSGESPGVETVASAENVSAGSGIPGAAGLAGGVVAGGGVLAVGATGVAALAGLAGNPNAASQITLTPRAGTAGSEATSNSQADVEWTLPAAQKEAVRQEGGRDLALRLYDVTHVDLTTQRPQSFQEFLVAEEALNQTVPILPNRDHIAEIGYLTSDRRWLALARSHPIRVTAPTVAPTPSVDRSQITLTPRPNHQAYAKWLTPEAHKAELRQHGGRSLELRLYDLTAADPNEPQPPFEAFPVSETASTYTAVIQPDRDFIAEIGYLTEDRYWLSLARSNAIRIPSAPGAGVVLGGAAIGAGLTALGNQSQTATEAVNANVEPADLSREALAAVDEGLSDLPEGYGESRIVLMPRDPQWGYAYWDIPNEQREALRQQGGQRLALRLYDVTGVDLNHRSAHSLQQYDCEELARDWYVPIPVSDRDYIAEIGYLTGEGHWLLLARSNPVRIPPIYPSEWLEDHLISVAWEDDLRGSTLWERLSPDQQVAAADSTFYEQIFDLAQTTEVLRASGSLFGSMPHIPGSGQQFPSQAISSYVFTSGVSLKTAPIVLGGPTLSGLTISGVGRSSLSVPGVGIPGFTLSGIGMSGIGMSGIGLGALMSPLRARKFWLVADAEIIVYGATEPDATVTIDGRPIQLNPDGTFRFHLSFQDGVLNFPIIAVAADGEQSRSIHMTFERETPYRKTNTKDEAVDEWLGG